MQERNDLPPWACVVGLLPTSVAFVLGLSVAACFLIYIAVTTSMIIIWLLESILQQLQRLNTAAAEVPSTAEK